MCMCIPMSLLTVNIGSSSLKLALFDDAATVRKAAVSVERIGATGTRLVIVGSGGAIEHRVEAEHHAEAIEQVFRHFPELFSSTLRAIGHRIVHGGVDHAKPEPITAD